MYNRSAAMHRLSSIKTPGDSRQQGAIAIEFAVLSVLFFTVLYAIAAYSLSFFFTLSLNYLSTEAARSAIRVDPTLPSGDYQLAVSRRVTATITGFWSSDWIDGGCDAPEEAGLHWTPLPSSGDAPSFGYLGSDDMTGPLLHVCIRMGRSPLPHLPGMRDRFIPKGKATTRL